MPNLAVAVANAAVTSIEGTFWRHSSRRQATLSGSDAGGRWGPPRAFPVLYLARPLDSAVIEAYRWNVDPVEGMTGAQLAPRKLWTVAVKLKGILDLTDPRSRSAVGLSDSDLSTPVKQYDATQAVARAAHQLDLHGVLAPAAEGTGQTLAVFDDLLTSAEHLEVVEVLEPWQVPADPRASAASAHHARRTPGSETRH